MRALRPGWMVVVVLTAAAAYGATRQSSVASGGESSFCGSGSVPCYSVLTEISGDAAFVSFSSTATNLVPGPQNAEAQVYLHDRVACTTTRISESPGGQPGNGNSSNSALSHDGRYLAFDSDATNLIPGGTSASQVFLYDRVTGELEVVSVNPGGQPGNSTSVLPTLSADGRYVAFMSAATDLLAGNADQNNALDIFVRDRQLGQTVRVSVSSDGDEANGDSRRGRISANGRYVVFDTLAGNLSSPTTPHYSVYLHDRDANNTGILDEAGGISTLEISLNSSGQPANDNAWLAAVSDDGRKVAFQSRATNLATGITNNIDDVFVRDTATGTTIRASLGPGGVQATAGSYRPRLTPSGSFLVFHSAAQQLVAGGHNGMTHVFRRDLATNENVIVSLTSAGELAASSSEDGTMSADGQTIAFASAARNLSPDDENPWVDTFVRLFRPADLNRDGTVDLADAALLQRDWDQDCSVVDMNGDGFVSLLDLEVFVAGWE